MEIRRYFIPITFITAALMAGIFIIQGAGPSGFDWLVTVVDLFLYSSVLTTMVVAARFLYGYWLTALHYDPSSERAALRKFGIVCLVAVVAVAIGLGVGLVLVIASLVVIALLSIVYGAIEGTVLSPHFWWLMAFIGIIWFGVVGARDAFGSSGNGSGRQPDFDPRINHETRHNGQKMP